MSARRLSRSFLRPLAALSASLGPIVAAALPASATIKEYQIRRMLNLKTECGVSGLDISVKDGKDRFYASCRNVAYYPDGVEVLCPDSEDERDCLIVTQKREFRHLHHLKPADQDER